MRGVWASSVDHLKLNQIDLRISKQNRIGIIWVLYKLTAPFPNSEPKMRMRGISEKSCCIKTHNDSNVKIQFLTATSQMSLYIHMFEWLYDWQ